ncbi:hypothetical protein WMF27_41340 [Sorangium sp. So ce281]|uniref:hypothetical protein n=1 Tax=unclassified Sorangium TaxID=2621164 RepID=UPI003F5E5DDF
MHDASPERRTLPPVTVRALTTASIANAPAARSTGPPSAGGGPFFASRGGSILASAEAFGPLALPEIAKRVVEVTDAERLALARAVVSEHPSRVFANALVNVAWRNGPIQDIHAGHLATCPIDRCRVTVAEERELMKFTANRMAVGMDVCVFAAQ